MPTKNYKNEVIGMQRVPQNSVWEKNALLVSRLASKFGLSPSDRVGLEVSLEKRIEMDELEKILNS